MLAGSERRLPAFVELAQRHPEARLLFAGGAAPERRGRGAHLADLAAAQLRAAGLDLARVRFERTSGTTWENAVEAFRAAQPRRGERWVLVTSALHLPRAVGAFRRAGWDPIPYPAAEGDGSAVREWVALLAYRLRGRTSALLARPSMPSETSAADVGSGTASG